jgi:hypothetical protein
MKKFRENVKTAVLTSKYVMHEQSPILYIAHHEDGMWEFWGCKTIDEGEIMVVTLQQLIQLDPTIQKVADLPMGTTAFRMNIDAVWTVQSEN